MEQHNSILIGTGVLTWCSFERVTDRYGTVHFIDLDASQEPPSELFLKDIKALEQKNSYGKLTALVLKTRQSKHIGDLFRGFKPSTPKVDDKIILGSGFIFTQKHSDVVSVGLRPTIHRKSDWLIPKNLFKVHEQTVALYFHPEIIPST